MDVVAPIQSHSLKPEADQRRIEKVAQGFESMFFSLLCKEMRSTLEPETMFGDDKGDVFGGMFDQFLGEHLQGLKGYEYYAQMAKIRASLPPEFDTASIYLQNNIWGSPKTCLEKLERINTMMGADEFVAVFSYGSMSVEKAEASMRLFADKVLPATQAFAPADVPLLVS